MHKVSTYSILLSEPNSFKFHTKLVTFSCCCKFGKINMLCNKLTVVKISHILFLIENLFPFHFLDKSFRYSLLFEKIQSFIFLCVILLIFTVNSLVCCDCSFYRTCNISQLFECDSWSSPNLAVYFNYETFSTIFKIINWPVLKPIQVLENSDIIFGARKAYTAELKCVRFYCVR